VAGLHQQRLMPIAEGQQRSNDAAIKTYRCDVRRVREESL